MSQVVSELQQEIYSTYTFPSMRMSIRPSDLIFYNVLEELPVDDPRLDPQCIALYCQNEGTSLKNTLETFFEVRQCAPTESVSLIQRSGNVNDLKNINVLIQISGYEIQTSSSYSGTLVSSPFPQNNPREHANQKPPEFQLPAIGLDSNAPAGTDFPSADRVLLDEMEIAVMNEVGTDHGINPRYISSLYSHQQYPFEFIML
ncbi:hypothetical protein HK098_003591 [Nowakowskiella sp. JEL0407]|nr:hypothetical protein HK098_003591 [Nowakowskiella sp. JEL0407]